MLGDNIGEKTFSNGQMMFGEDGAKSLAGFFSRAWDRRNIDWPGTPESRYLSFWSCSSRSNLSSAILSL